MWGYRKSAALAGARAVWQWTAMGCCAAWLMASCPVAAQAPEALVFADQRVMELRCEGRLWNALALYLDAPVEAHAGIWIDRNGNGRYDEGIDMAPGSIRFGEWHEYYFGGSTLRIYGGVTTLQCDYSDPMRLYVAGNPSLEVLNCEGNRLLALDLGESPNLRQLNCNNNLLTELDVSHSSKLEVLWCAGNQFHEVYLRKLPQLIDLDASYNYLKQLDLRANTLLQRLDCRNSDLKALDMRTLTRLQTLDCSQNKLTHLNLQGNPDLTLLNCSHNRLERLDLQEQKSLQRLICSHNKLKTLTVAAPSELVYADIQQNQLPASEVGYFVEGLQTLAAVHPPMLDLFARHFPYGELYLQGPGDRNGATLATVAAAQEKHWKVTTLLDTTNQEEVTTPTEEGMMTLVTDSNTQRIKLWLEAAPEHKNHIWLDVNADGVFNAQLDLDAHKIRYNEWITVPTFGHQLRIYGPVATLLLSNQGTVTEISVEGNPRLRKLGCSNNAIAALDVTHNPNLETLICSQNPIAALDVSQNEALRELHCNGMRLTALNLEKNKQLRRLYCLGNQLRALDLRRNKQLERLDCSGNLLLTLDLRRNTKLQHLGCAANGLVRLSLARCEKLHYISFFRNRLPHQEMKAIIARLPTLMTTQPDWLDPETYTKYYGFFKATEPGDGNAFTPQLLEQVKAKHWKPALAE